MMQRGKRRLTFGRSLRCAKRRALRNQRSGSIRASSDERKVKRMINVLDINEDGKEIVTELKIERNMGWDGAGLLVSSVCLPPRISCSNSQPA